MTTARDTLGFVRCHSFLVCLSGLLLGGGCERTHNLVSRGSDDAEIGDAADLGDAGFFDGAVTTTDAGVVLCGKRACACANGIDDDGDRLVDGFDPECTGPYDQDELTFATGEVKEGSPKCSDCFFDGNPGSGDDDCKIASSCARDATTAVSSGSCRTCTPTPECVDNCLPRTPNGCDCFGCCEVHSGESTLPILLVDTCSLADLGDETKCPRCIPNTECINPCGRCELCAGKTLATLPADCGNEYTCDEAEVCGTDQSCPASAYCVQGCCAPVLF